MPYNLGGILILNKFSSRDEGNMNHISAHDGSGHMAEKAPKGYDLQG
jgi:hypothetical protein